MNVLVDPNVLSAVQSEDGHSDGGAQGWLHPCAGGGGDCPPPVLGGQPAPLLTVRWGQAALLAGGGKPQGRRWQKGFTLPSPRS